MKRFHFSLEQAMHWRRLRADTERTKLELLHAGLRRLEAKKCASTRKNPPRIATSKTRTQCGPVSYSPSITLHATRPYKGNMWKRGAWKCSRNPQQQVKLVSAQRDFELLEKLKAQKQQDWQKAFDLEQEQLASEVYMAKWERKCS